MRNNCNSSSDSKYSPTLVCNGCCGCSCYLSSFPQDPNLSEWVSAWFIGGGNNGGGGWVLWFDSTPLVWIFLCALGPSSFWRWCDFWWQATKHRLQVDISRMATCVSGLTNDWLGGTGMAYSRFLAHKGRGWGGGRRSGRRTLNNNAE